MTIQQHASFDSSAAELNATSKLVKAWESKNARNAAKAGGVSLMALSLAACGGSSDTAINQDQLDAGDAGGDGADAGTPVAVTTDSFIYDKTGETGVQNFIAGAGVIDSMTIFGGDNDDSLTVTLNDDDDGASFSMTSVEAVSIKVSSAATGAITLDVADVTDVESWTLDRIAQNVTLDNLSDLSASFNFTDIDDDAMVATLQFDAADVSGTADELLLGVDSVTATGTALQVVADGIEAVDLTVSGEDNVVDLSSMTALTAVDVSGTGDISLTANVADIDASENSGGVTWTATAASGVSAIGGAGDDTFDVSSITSATTSDTSSVSMGSGDDVVTISLAGAAASGLSVDGGEGDDTLVVAATATTISSASASLTGFETLHIDVTTSVNVVADSAGIDVETIELDFASTASAAVTGQTDEAISLSIGTGTVTVSVASTATTGTSESISLSLAGDAATTTTSTSVATVNLTLNSYETISLSIGDATTSSGSAATAAAYTVNLTSSEAEVISVDATSGVDLTLALSATAATSLEVSGSGDVTVSGNPAGLDISAIDMTGDLTMTSTAVAGTAAADAVSVALGAGDDTISLGIGRLDVDLGGGDDTVTITTAGVADLTRRDTLDGGTGTDVIKLAGAAGAIDLSVDGFETLTVSASSTTATVALDGATEIVAIAVTATSSAVVSITGVSATEIDLDVSAATGSSTVSMSNSSSGTSDIVNVAVASTTASTASVGSITLVGAEVVNISVDVATTTTTAGIVQFGTLSASSATTIVVDASAAGNSIAFAGIALGVDATIDLTDADDGVSISGAVASATSATAWTAATSGAVSGTAGIVLSGTGINVTITLDDDKTGTVVTYIDLGTEADAGDTVEIVNSSSLDNIGTIVIDNFLDRTNNSVDKASVIDLSGLDIADLSELTLTNNTSSTAAIFFDDYTGVIVLVGVDAADLTSANFTFA